MTLPEKTPEPTSAPRSVPDVVFDESGALNITVNAPREIETLLGMKTRDGAHGVFKTALEALGASVSEKAETMAAIFAEIEPRDAVEAMLVAQMAATHVTLSLVSAKVSHAGSIALRESCERSMTRLSRTYLAQMEGLKKYRAKAQQIVRVERVTVGEGGQAIVGHVTHQGGGCGEK